jgi:competence protein ComEC
MWRRIMSIVLALVVGGAQPAGSALGQELLDNTLVVRFLDAGDGEAVWITTPSPDRSLRSTVVINCGPPAFGGRLALQLQAAKVRQIDTLLLSGASDELIGGCSDLLQQVPIGEIRWTGQVGNTPTWAALEAVLEAQQWHLLGLAAQDTMTWGDVQATVLNPADNSDSRVDPDNSLVLHIGYSTWGILYAGDIHARGERQSMERLGSRLAPIQVLKVADHGQATSSSPAFLSAVFGRSVPGVARTAVVTNGRTAYSPQIEDAVVDNLAAVKAEIVNTGQHGTVSVVVDPVTGPRIVTER